MAPDMITCSCFTAREDRATLRSDLSGIQGYTGAALSVLLFFFAPVETQSDKPRGSRGRAPWDSSPRRFAGQRVLPGSDVMVELAG